MMNSWFILAAGLIDFDVEPSRGILFVTQWHSKIFTPSRVWVIIQKAWLARADDTFGWHALHPSKEATASNYARHCGFNLLG